MVRKWFMMLTILLLALSLTACKPAPPEQEEVYPTLPEFDQTQTPAQQLSSAIEKTGLQNTYEVRYGIITSRDGQTDEIARTQSVSPDQPLNRTALSEYLPMLPNRDGFLSDFCGSPLRIIPSNTGVLRYQLSELDWETASAMMYTGPMQSEYENMLCEIALEVDGDGRMSRVEIILSLENEKQITFLEFTFPDGI